MIMRFGQLSAGVSLRFCLYFQSGFEQKSRVDSSTFKKIENRGGEASIWVRLGI